MNRLQSLSRMGVVLSVFLLIACVLVLATYASPSEDDLLIRVEIRSSSELISISAPFTILDALYEVASQEIRQELEHHHITPAELREGLQHLIGQDLVHVNGEENIRVWMEYVNEMNKKDLNYVKVHVQDSGNTNIYICIPRTLVQLSGQVAKSLGLIEKYLVIPEEFKQTQIVQE